MDQYFGTPTPEAQPPPTEPPAEAEAPAEPAAQAVGQTDEKEAEAFIRGFGDLWKAGVVDNSWHARDLDFFVAVLVVPCWMLGYGYHTTASAVYREIQPITGKWDGGFDIPARLRSNHHTLWGRVRHVVNQCRSFGQMGPSPILLPNRQVALTWADKLEKSPEEATDEDKLSAAFDFVMCFMELRGQVFCKSVNEQGEKTWEANRRFKTWSEEVMST